MEESSETSTARDEAAAVRLAANLVVQPTAIRALIEYWFRHYHPALLLPTQEAQAVAAALVSPHAVDWMAALLRRLQEGPDDFALNGRGNFFAKSGGGPIYLHWFTLFSLPGYTGAPDLSYAVPVPYLKEAHLKGTLMALNDVYRRARGMWRTQRSAVFGGQHHFADCTYSAIVQRMYQMELFVVEALCWWLNLLLKLVPTHVLVRIAGPLMQTVAAALPTADSGCVLAGVGRLILEHRNDVSTMGAQIMEIRQALAARAGELYKEIRESYRGDGLLREQARREEVAGDSRLDAPPERVILTVMRS